MRNTAQLVTELKDEVLAGVPLFPANEAYKALSSEFPIQTIENDQQHAAALNLTERLIDFCNKHEKNEDVYGYLNALTTFVELYEKKRFPTKHLNPSDMLSYLMDIHDLKQTDLGEELGGQSVVSEILNGKRELNIRQIRSLSERFHVSPAVFF